MFSFTEWFHRRRVQKGEASSEAKIKRLERELTRVREELESERQQLITDDSEGVQEEFQSQEKDEAIRNHWLQEIRLTNSAVEQRNELATETKLTDTRWAQKENQLQELCDMVTKILEDRETDRIRADEERAANVGKPGMFYS